MSRTGSHRRPHQLCAAVRNEYLLSANDLHAPHTHQTAAVAAAGGCGVF